MPRVRPRFAAGPGEPLSLGAVGRERRPRSDRALRGGRAPTHGRHRLRRDTARRLTRLHRRRRRTRTRPGALLRRQPHAGALRRPRPPGGGGGLRPAVDRYFPPEETAAAHRAPEAGGVRGKHVVRVD
ncbi:zinc-binding dehydrogenase [Microtetraspora malaysiensis]|uniref:zinc-binding dehydrogenase n=1 Tax=Microtetraspora malaysiensis TaxID=161358 RepID=UPI003D918751